MAAKEIACSDFSGDDDDLNAMNLVHSLPLQEISLFARFGVCFLELNL